MHIELQKDDTRLRKNASEAQGDNYTYANKKPDLSPQESIGEGNLCSQELTHGSWGQVAMQFKASSEHLGLQENGAETIQRTARHIGLPDTLKAGIEHLSGYSMDDVKVHYNSSKPAQLKAHAFAHGRDIHIGPRQEKYLPHEAWHVVQQKQGRVRSTLQMKGGFGLNDDSRLEHEADVMGDRALQQSETPCTIGKLPAWRSQRDNASLRPSTVQVNSPIVQLASRFEWLRRKFRKKNKSIFDFEDAYDGTSAEKMADGDALQLYVYENGKFRKGKIVNQKRIDIIKCYNVDNVGGNEDNWIWIHFKNSINREFPLKTGYAKRADVNNLTRIDAEARKDPREYGLNSGISIAQGQQPEDPIPFTNDSLTWLQNQMILMQAYDELASTKQNKLGLFGRLYNFMGSRESAEERVETMNDIAFFSLQSFAKAAPKALPNRRLSYVNRKLEYGYKSVMESQVSPIFSTDSYYRNGSSVLYRQLREQVERDLGFSNTKASKVEGEEGTREDPSGVAKVEIVANKAISDVMFREFPLPRRLTKANTKHATTSQKIAHLTDFEAVITQLIQAGVEPQNTIMFDFSELYSHLKCRPGNIEEKICKPCRNVLNKIDNVDLKEKINEKIGAMILLEHRGMNVFLLLALGDFESIKSKTGNILNHNGQIINPLMARKSMLQYKDVRGVLKDEAFPLTRPSKPFDDRKMSLTEFFQHDSFGEFKAFSAQKNLPPYQAVHSAAIISLLKGLNNIKVSNKYGYLRNKLKQNSPKFVQPYFSSEVDKIFEYKNLSTLLFISYRRMLNAMKDSVAYARVNNMTKFLSQIEFLHDQLQMILAIVKPYDQNEAFERVIIEHMRKEKHLPDYIGNPQFATASAKRVNEQAVKVQVDYKPSSMNTLSSIMTAAEQQKGHNRLNVLVLEHSYYEGIGTADTHGLIRAEAYDVSKVNAKGKVESTSTLGAEGADSPYDILICEFHHNFGLAVEKYVREDVCRIVKLLLANELVAKPFTVAIDCTLDYIQSQDIQEFLIEFQNPIEKGELNVVFFRSAQKFDMLGMDNYYGGYSIAVNNSNEFQKFNAELRKHPLQGLAAQGLSYLAENGAEHLDAYRQALIDNTRYLYTRLKTNDDACGRLGLRPTEDNNAFFLHIQGGLHNFRRLLKDWAYYNDLEMGTRNSFGFSTLNLTEIAPCLRINPGLESREDLDKYADYLIKYALILANGGITQVTHEGSYTLAALKEGGLFHPQTSVEDFVQRRLDHNEKQAEQSDSKKINKRTKRFRLPAVPGFKFPKFIRPRLAFGRGRKSSKGKQKKAIRADKIETRNNTENVDVASEDKHSVHPAGAIVSEDFTLNATTGDGNCFYHALYECITEKRSKSQNATAIRQQLAQAIRVENQQYVTQDELAHSDITLEKLIDNLSTEGEYNHGEISLVLASRVLSVTITVHQPSGAVTTYLVDNPVMHIHMYYNGINHWDSYTQNSLDNRRSL